MDISGLIQSYDSRTASSAALTRAIAAPQYVHQTQPYSGVTSGNLLAPHQQLQLQQQNPFSFSPYTSGSPNGLVPAFANNYIQQRPLPRLVNPDNSGGRGASYVRNNTQGFVEEILTQSPSIKVESQWASPTASSSYMNTNTKTITSVPVSEGAEVNFGTEVDTLMKAIQAKSQSSTSPQPMSSVDQKRSVVGASPTSPIVPLALQGNPYTSGETSRMLMQEEHQDETSSPRAGKKRYQCTIGNCGKSFYQKTHLDIHERAHTGDKPYLCKEPNCGRSFSQRGNLKTHKRRHTGERPYKCDLCDKRFAQRGNVRAHRIVHEQAKPYLCRLDDCGKQFTQLGNLKSHQNKFHIATIRNLTAKFASIQNGDTVTAADKDLWEYFANLYKNSNKGIKGRGKDRKVSPNPHALNSGMRHLGVGVSGGYSMNGAGRGNMMMGMMGPGRSEGSQYEMFDADDESQSGSQGGSVASTYDDVPSDGYEENTRGAELAFGDRIY